MTFRMVKTIYLKEMLDMFRDRRSLISMIVVPVLAVPSLFAVVHYFTQNLGKKAQNESARVGISASVSQPGLTGALKSVGFELVPQTDARAAVENKSVAASLDLTRAADGTGQIVIYVDKTREASSIAAERLTAFLERLKLEQVKSSLRGLGVSERVLNPFTVKSTNVAPAKKMAGFILGSVLGYAVLLLMFTGGMYPAIDMTAGEKERHTMETLLASPASREEIVLMPFWNGRTFVLQGQGVPVDIEYIPGTMLVGNGFPVLRGGKFVEQTNRFCNITMDGQYQMMMTQRFFYPPSNRNAKLPPDLARYAFPADKEKNVVPIDYEKMNAHKSQYLDRWNKEVLGA